MRTGPRHTRTGGNKDREADRNGQGAMRIRSKTDRDRDNGGQGQRQSGNVVVRTEIIYRAKRQGRANGVRTARQKTGKIKDSQRTRRNRAKDRPRERR